MRLFVFFSNLVGIMLAGSIMVGAEVAGPEQTFEYHICAGDTLSEIALMFTGSSNSELLARLNKIADPDLIYSGTVLAVSTPKPVAALKKYLSSIYEDQVQQAYALLSQDTQNRFTYQDFQTALAEMSYFDLETIVVCGHRKKDGFHQLRMKVQMEEDPADWGFNLILEQHHWRVELLDLFPTFPQESGGLDCQ